jgi:hypothetical protein
MSAGFFVPEWSWGYVDHRRRLFRPGARCTGCGIADPIVLVFRSRPLSCQACWLERLTGRRTELHHLGGRPSSVTVEVDANLHEWLSLYQYGWRGRLAPGSPEAVLCDLLVLYVMRVQERHGASA